MQNLHRTRIWAALVLWSALAACDSIAVILGPVGEQGIEGIVLLGPQCPVQSLEDPCPDLPHQAWVEVRTSGGVVTGRFQSGEDGRFRVGLPIGSYVLDPESGDPFPIGSEMNVEVTEGLFTDVTISFDTGIR